MIGDKLLLPRAVGHGLSSRISQNHGAVTGAAIAAFAFAISARSAASHGRLECLEVDLSLKLFGD